jgi:hypothetical protein
MARWTIALCIAVILTSKMDTLSDEKLVTRVGVSNTNSPDVLDETDARVVRVVIKDHQIAERSKAGKMYEFERELIALRRRNVEVIVTLRFPERRRERADRGYDRVPGGGDKSEALKWVRRLLIDVGRYIDWLQIADEPAGGSGQYRREDTLYDARLRAIPAIAWWTELAQEIRKMRGSDTGLLSLKMMSPGLTDVLRRAQGRRSDVDETKFIEAMIDFAQNHTDALDVRLHVASVEDTRKITDYVRARTKMALTCAEWSQALAARDWLDRPVKEKRFGDGTNAHFVQRCYDKPVDVETWRAFVATAPFSPNFIEDQCRVLNEAKFLHACYGGVWQSGNPTFDVRALYADKTVRGTNPRNEPFISDLTASARKSPRRE